MTSPAWEKYDSSDRFDTPTYKDFPSAFPEFSSKKEKSSRSDIDWGRTIPALFDKARQTDKYRDYAERSSSPKFGDWSRGGSGQILENLGAVYPQQQGPMYFPGVEGSKSGLGSAIGTLAGIGASFIPGLGPGIAAAMPAIGGSIGSFF